MPASTKINIDLALNTKGFRPLGRINGQLGEFEKSLDASNARVLAFGASAGAILAVKKAFTATVKAAIEVEKSLKDINVILQATSANLKRFGSDLFKIASDTGQAFHVAAEAATELARQGLGVEETLKRTRDALILARLSGMGAAEAVNALTAALNTFTKVGVDSTAIINKLANVDAAFAVSSDDLAKAIGRVGSSAVAAGVSLDQLLAIVTTAQQKTARGGAVIGNSFKTIFTRIQRPRVIKELENLGIAVRNVSGETLPALKVLTNLAKTFDSLTAAQRAQISELVGGVFQVNILKAAMSDLSREQSIYNRALEISIGSSDQAIKRNEALNETLAAQFQKTLNTFKEAAAELGTLTLAPALENIFGGINKSFEAAAGDSGLASAGQLIGKSVFEAIGKFIGGPGLVIIGGVLFKTFANLATFAADAFKTLTGLNKQFQNQLNLQRQIMGVLQENPDLMNRIKNGTLSVEDAHQLVLGRIKEETLALNQQLAVSNLIATKLGGGGVRFSSEFGATSGKTPKFGGKSGGYVPNFAKGNELAGMMMGGYSSSQLADPKIRKSLIHNGSGGAFSADTNGHESIIDFINGRGKKATAVIPPRGTSAFDDFVKSLSGGYVPNFATGIAGFVKNYKGKNLLADVKAGVANRSLKGQAVNVGTGEFTADQINEARVAGMAARQKSKKGGKRGFDHSFDVAQKFGVLSLFGETGRRTNISANTSEIRRLKPYAKDPAMPPKVQFTNFQSKGFLGLEKDMDANNDFSKLIKKHMSRPLENIATEFGQQQGLGDDTPNAKRTVSSMQQGYGGALFPPGAEGSIFEGAINAMTKNAVAFERSLRGSANATWDFEEAGNVNSKLRKSFGFSKFLQRADAKRTVSTEAMSSLGNKIFNAVEFGKGGGAQEINRFVKSFAQNKQTAAGGYVPNFNALHNAVQRERAAGVPSSRIRVGSSASLASGLNPLGLGVYNTAHEPGGLGQGIRRSLAGGRNPKMAGIPNFAPESSVEAKSSAKLMKLTMGIMGLQMAMSMLNNSIGEETDENRSVKMALDKLGSTLMMVGGMFAMAEFLPGKMTASGAGSFWGKSRSMKGAGSSMGGMLMAGNPFSAENRAKRLAGKTFERTSPIRDGIGTRTIKGTHPTMFKAGTLETSRTVAGKTITRTRKGAPSKLSSGVGGMGVMGVAAVGIGVAQAMEFFMDENNAASKNLKRLNTAYEKQAESTEKNIGKLNKLGEATEAYAGVFNDSNATIKDVIRAHDVASEAMVDLPFEIRKSIQGFLDPKQMQHAIKLARETEQEKKDAAERSAASQKDLVDIRGNQFTLTDFKGEAGKELDRIRGEDIARRVLKSLSPEAREKLFSPIGQSTEDRDRNVDFFRTMGGVSRTHKSAMSVDNPQTDAASEKVMRILKDVGSTLPEKQQLEFQAALGDNVNAAYHMANGMVAVGRELEKTLAIEKLTNPEREKTLAATKATEDAIRKTIRAMDQDQKIRIATIPILKKGAEAFLSGTGKVALKEQLAIDNVKENINNQMKSAVVGLGTTFGQSGSLQGTAIETRVQSVLAEAAKGPGGLDANNIETLIKEIDVLAKGEEDSFEKDILKDISDHLANLNGTSTRLAEDQKEQILLTQQIAEAEKMMAKQQQRLKSFGGAQAIINPKSLDSVINQIKAGEQTMGMMSGRNTKGFNRADASRLAGIQTLLGGELPDHLKQRGIAAATQVKRGDVALMNKRFGLGLGASEINRIANEQAAALFKGQPMDENNRKLQSLADVLKESNLLWTTHLTGARGVAEASQEAIEGRSRNFQSFRKEFMPGAQGMARTYSQGQGMLYENQGTLGRGAMRTTQEAGFAQREAMEQLAAGERPDRTREQGGRFGTQVDTVNVHIDNSQIDTNALQKATIDRLINLLTRNSSGAASKRTAADLQRGNR